MTGKKRAFYEVDRCIRAENTKQNYQSRIFSKRFEEQMHKHGFSQRAFKDKAKMSSGSISNYCRGERTPGYYELLTITKTLDISADYLLGISDVPSLKKDIQAIAKYTGLSESSINYLNEISTKHTFNIDINHEIPKKSQKLMSLFNNRLNITDKYKLHALNFILENDKEYNFLELIGKYLFSTTIPQRGLIDIIEDASDRGVPKDVSETKRNKALEQFKNMMQEITYVDLSSFEENDTQSFGKLTQTEIHNAILVSLNNALSEALNKIKQSNKEIIEKKLKSLATAYNELYNDPYFHTAVSLEEDIITFLQSSYASSEKLNVLQQLLSVIKCIDNN